MSMPTARIGSPTTGHECWPSTIICQGASTVIGASIPVSCIGHAAIPHTCVVTPNPSHGLVIASASSTVIVEGLPVARVGDYMSCGDIIADGAPTIISGG